MISVPTDIRILVATKPVDFRRGADSLAALVREELQHDPFSGTLFIFRSKRARLTTFSIWFAICEDRLSLASTLWADAAGRISSSR